MSIFKNVKNGKCLSFGDYGHFMNNKPIQFEDCDIDDKTESIYALDTDSQKPYKIKYNNNLCFMPSQNPDNPSVVLGDCNDDSTHFDIRKQTENWDTNNEILNMYILFADNRSAIIGNQRRISNRLVSYPKALEGKNMENINAYFQCYDIKSENGRTINRMRTGTPGGNPNINVTSVDYGSNCNNNNTALFNNVKDSCNGKKYCKYSINNPTASTTTTTQTFPGNCNDEFTIVYNCNDGTPNKTLKANGNETQHMHLDCMERTGDEGTIRVKNVTHGDNCNNYNINEETGMLNYFKNTCDRNTTCSEKIKSKVDGYYELENCSKRNFNMVYDCNDGKNKYINIPNITNEYRTASLNCSEGFVEGFDQDDLNMHSITFSARMKYIVDELNENKEVVKTNTYYLRPDYSKRGVYFSTNEANERFVIQTARPHLYRRNNLDRRHMIQNHQYRMKILYVENNRKYFLKVDTNEYPNGISLSRSPTIFKYILKDGMNKFLMLYHYPYRNNTSKINISSQLNPRSKIYYHNNERLITRHQRDNIRHGRYIFEITNEGFDSENNLPQELQEFYQKMKLNPTSFHVFHREISAIKNKISKGLTGNELTHSSNTIRNLNTIHSLMRQLRNCYNNVKRIKSHIDNVMKNIQFFPFFITPSFSRSWHFNYNRYNRIIYQTSHVLRRMQLFKTYMNENNDLNAPDVEYANISVDLQLLLYICQFLHYLKRNSQTIFQQTITFYDYLNIKNETSFSFFKDSINFNIIKQKGYFSPSILRENQRMNIETFIQKSSYFKNNAMFFFDIDFTNIYDFFMSPNDNLNPNADSYYLSSENENYTENTYFNHYLKWMKSQKHYCNKNNELLTKSQSVRSIYNQIPSQEENYKNIVSSYISFIQNAKSKFPEINETNFPMIPFFQDTNESLSNEEDEKRIAYEFVSLYSKLENMDINISYENIELLESYYANSDLLFLMINKTIVKFFIENYNILYNRAQGQAGMILSSDTVQNVNNIDTFVGSKVENFDSNDSISVSKDNDDTLFPTRPKSLNLQHIYDVSSIKLLDDAFIYNYQGTEYKTFSDFVGKVNEDNNNTIKVDFNSVSGVYCQADENTPLNPEFSYYCPVGKTNDTINKYGSDMFNLCDQNENTRHSLKLTYDNTSNNKLIVKLDYNATETTIAEIDNVKLGAKLYDSTKYEDFKELYVEGNDIRMLKMIDEDVGETELPTAKSQNNCISFLLSDDGMVLIYINKDGKLKIKYKKDTLKAITGIDGGYADDNTSEENIYAHYDINTDKYKIGDNLTEVGFIGYNGDYHKVEDRINVGDNGYEELGTDYNYTNPTETSPTVGIPECTGNDECIGYLDDGTNITRENAKYLYRYTDITNSSNQKYYHKKYSSNEKTSCTHDSSNTTLYYFDDISGLKQQSGNPFSEIDCGFDDLLSKNKSDLTSKRNDLDESFQKMVSAFNDLNEQQLKMLQNTELNVSSLKQMLEEYKDLREDTVKIKDKRLLARIQKEDSKQLYQSMQTTNALIGIGTLALALGAFHFIRK
jgi:hypothetical protein